MFKIIFFISFFAFVVGCDQIPKNDQEDPVTIVTPKADINANNNAEAIDDSNLVLDLSLPDDDKLFLLDNSEPKVKLPANFFYPEAEQKRWSFKGGLILDSSEVDYLDSVKGAEIKIEVKTN